MITGLINAYKTKLDAANTQDRIAADLAAKEIEAEISARKEASAIIIAEQGRWYTAIIRPLLAFPLVIYLWKVIVWEKAPRKAGAISRCKSGPGNAVAGRPEASVA